MRGGVERRPPTTEVTQTRGAWWGCKVPGALGRHIIGLSIRATAIRFVAACPIQWVWPGNVGCRGMEIRRRHLVSGWGRTLHCRCRGLQREGSFRRPLLYLGGKLAGLLDMAHGVISTVGEFLMLPSLFAAPFFGAMAAVTMGFKLCMKVSFRSSCEPRAVCLSLCRAQRSCRTKDRWHSGKSQW